ncbi:MAG: DUF3298 and DUF4163 domain-containing protein [Capnocytophaga sp.]|nr:DUF3298 and DUF4163 domain-containing protein [Capnocytophaga sp.]
MKKKIALYIISSTLLSSCGWFSSDMYKFDNQEVLQNDCSTQQENDSENSDCAEVTINYLKAKKPQDFAEKFNDTIQKRILRILLGENTEKTTIEAASDQFLKLYKADNELYGPVPPYEIQITDSIFFQNEKIVSLASFTYEYAGGAHGIGNTTFLNFKPSGDCYTNDELFVDKNKVKEIAEKYFRKQTEIGEGQTYSDNGFWFEEDVFQLPENIGFKDKEMILFYNPYEIAPYSFGAFEIHIPLEEVKEWIQVLP